MSLKKKISMTVNGRLVNAEIEPRRHLVDFLREDLHLKGPHLGCEQGACGACTVKVDGQIIRGCLFLAVQADGRRSHQKWCFDRSTRIFYAPQRYAVRLLLLWHVVSCSRVD